MWQAIATAREETTPPRANVRSTDNHNSGKTFSTRILGGWSPGQRNQFIRSIPFGFSTEVFRTLLANQHRSSLSSSNKIFVDLRTDRIRATAACEPSPLLLESTPPRPAFQSSLTRAVALVGDWRDSVTRMGTTGTQRGSQGVRQSPW